VLRYGTGSFVRVVAKVSSKILLLLLPRPAGSSAERDAARATRRALELEAELDAIRGSGWWRLASVYWRGVRSVRRLVSRLRRSRRSA